MDSLRRGRCASYKALRDAAVAGLADSDDTVRRAAASAVLQLTMHVQPEAADDADVILPPLIAALAVEQQPARAREAVAAALDACLASLDDETVPQHLAQFMPPLLQMLETAPASAHDTVLSCVASAAAASGAAFAPYAQAVLPRLARAMQAKAATALRMRAMATDCAGARCQCADAFCNCLTLQLCALGMHGLHKRSMHLHS